MTSTQTSEDDQADRDDRIDLGTFGRATKALLLAEFLLALAVCVVVAPTLWPVVVLLGFAWALWASMIR